MKQEITDLDGWGQENKPVVTVLGGFIGQLVIVLNTIAKYYPQLDRPVRTGRSQASRPKSTHSKKSEDEKKSARSGGAASEGQTSTEPPRMILNPKQVQ